MSEITILKCQVRRDKETKELNIFFKNYPYSLKNGYSCFTFSKWHSDCDNHFRMITCEPVDEQTAIDFVAKVQKFYDILNDGVDVRLQLVKRF